MNKLSDDEIQERIIDLDNWQLNMGQLYKQYEFKDFKEALDFINKLAVTINKINHHPDLTNSYNKVSLRLSTHIVDGISDLDFDLAKSADILFTTFSKST